LMRGLIMDANKLEVLRRMPYKINKVCGLCAHSEFVSESAWGGCQKHLYDHLKHKEPAKPLSIHMFGTCPAFTMGAGCWALKSLGAYEEFLEK